MIFLPYLLGERAPIWNADAKGVLFGLTNQSWAGIHGAGFPGRVFIVYMAISQPLWNKRKSENIYATGGFARNELWMQIMADVFNLPVLVCETVENSAWGAVKCGMQALGIRIPEETMISKKYFPDAATHSVYQKAFKNFSVLYELLKEEFNNESRNVGLFKAGS